VHCAGYVSRVVVTVGGVGSRSFRELRAAASATHREIGGDDDDNNALHGGANDVTTKNVQTIIVYYDFSIREKKQYQ